MFVMFAAFAVLNFLELALALSHSLALTPGRAPQVQTSTRPIPPVRLQSNPIQPQSDLNPAQSSPVQSSNPRTMASSICLRCLSRPLASIEQSLVARPGPLAATSSLSQHTSSFSTSTCLAATPPKKKGPAMAVKKGSQYKQGRVGGGNNRAKTGRPPAAGERKAMRKRVVLSNTNALEVRDLEDLTAGNASEAARLGQVMGLSNETVDALRAIEAFKPTQGWSLFRRPATLVRKETLDMAALVNEVRVEKKTVRKVVFGDRGAGKSVLLLQAMAMGFLNNFVVVHIPEGMFVSLALSALPPSCPCPSSTCMGAPDSDHFPSQQPKI